MSHTMHRRGADDSFGEETIIFAMTAKKFNEVNSSGALREFLGILDRYDLSNMGDMKTGNRFITSREAILDNVQDTSIVHGVFTSKAQAKAALKEIREADLGVSVNVVGVIDDVHALCQEVGIDRHTVEYSLGIRGKLGKLPEDDLLEITTMCGHGMVSQHLARRALLALKNGEMTAQQAAELLATPCVCGVFNPRRAAMLLEELADIWLVDQS